jgi:hypothetical protein
MTEYLQGILSGRRVPSLMAPSLMYLGKPFGQNRGLRPVG